MTVVRVREEFQVEVRDALLQLEEMGFPEVYEFQHNLPWLTSMKGQEFCLDDTLQIIQRFEDSLAGTASAQAHPVLERLRGLYRSLGGLSNELTR